MLTFSDDPALLAAAAACLAEQARGDRLGRVTLRSLDGVAALDAAAARGPVVSALLDAGFSVTPPGLRVGR